VQIYSGSSIDCDVIPVKELERVVIEMPSFTGYWPYLSSFFPPDTVDCPVILEILPPSSNWWSNWANLIQKEANKTQSDES
jgi:hypothetical protein